MTVKEMMAAKKARKIAIQAKQPIKAQIKAPLLQAMNDLAYKLRNNTLTMKDTYNLLLLLQHTYFIQSVDKTAGFNWLGIRYLNNIKQAIENALQAVIKNCVLTEDGYYASSPDAKLTIYKQTRNKILWFIVKTYDKTSQILNNAAVNKASGGNLIVAKHIKYAKEMLDMSLIARDSNIRTFLTQ